MNATRREQLQGLASRISDIKGELESIKDEEQYYINNMPENMQGGEKYANAEEAVNNMEEAIDNLDSAEGSLESI